MKQHLTEANVGGPGGGYLGGIDALAPRSLSLGRPKERSGIKKPAGAERGGFPPDLPTLR